MKGGAVGDLPVRGRSPNEVQGTGRCRGGQGTDELGEKNGYSVLELRFDRFLGRPRPEPGSTALDDFFSVGNDEIVEHGLKPAATTTKRVRRVAPAAQGTMPPHRAIPPRWSGFVQNPWPCTPRRRSPSAWSGRLDRALQRGESSPRGLLALLALLGPPRDSSEYDAPRQLPDAKVMPAQRPPGRARLLRQVGDG